MRIGVIPLKIKLLDVESNMQEADRRLAAASRTGLELLVLPEMALTGYIYEVDDLQNFAEPLDGEQVKFWRDMAQKYMLNLVVGFAERWNGAFYSTSLLISESGELVGVYRKINEKPPLAKGDAVSSFRIKGTEVAMLICGDLFHDVTKKRISAIRPKVLAVPMFRCFDGESPNPRRWESEERQVYIDAVKGLADYILISNGLEITNSEGFGGGLIVTGNGELLAESPHGTDVMVFVDIE